MTDDAKKMILARRARFVAAAVAASGIGLACGKEKAAPCLSMATMSDDADAGPPPAPCLSVYNPPPDAAPPRACLSAPIRRDAGTKKCDPNDPLCSE
jgi:hypothetical protein